MTTCPRCGASGRAVAAETVAALVVSDRMDEIVDAQGGPAGWRLCSGPGCEVVYFAAGEAVVLADVVAVPFHKSRDPARLVCFCFGHSVAAVEADARAHGGSKIQAAIKAECRAGHDDCERKSPHGRCCLGHVGQVVKDALGADGDASDDDPEGCCGPSSR
ncbi:MAG: copper chaperone Copz family protein [Haliangiales bacterium]